VPGYLDTTIYGTKGTSVEVSTSNKVAEGGLRETKNNVYFTVREEIANKHTDCAAGHRNFQIDCKAELPLKFVPKYSIDLRLSLNCSLRANIRFGCPIFQGFLRF
jgi:hypothetical protein